MSAGLRFGVALEMTTVTMSASTATAATELRTIAIRRLRFARACCFLNCSTFALRRSSRSCLTVSFFADGGTTGSVLGVSLRATRVEFLSFEGQGYTDNLPSHHWELSMWTHGLFPIGPDSGRRNLRGAAGRLAEP